MSSNAYERMNLSWWVYYALNIGAALLVLGCQIRPDLPITQVEYQSSIACATSPEQCPWTRLEQEARFSAKANCLLSGATVILSKDFAMSTGEEGDLVEPIAPRDGYERLTDTGDGRACALTETVCRLASRHDRELTWASCGSRSPGEAEFRGGQDLGDAHRLTESEIVTGNLTSAHDTFKAPLGLDGPDHFYTFTLDQAMRIEAAVGANSSFSSLEQGHRAPWQSGLYLLSSKGKTLAHGRVWRGGVTYLLPAKMGPGTYYLVVDSSHKEYTRGDGLYHLYLGIDNGFLGPIDHSISRLQESP